MPIVWRRYTLPFKLKNGYVLFTQPPNLTKNQLTPEWAVEVLRKYGREVTIEEAAAILELLRKMAKMVVAQYLRNKDDNLKKTGLVQ